MTLGIVDWAILAVYTAFVLGIGFVAVRKTKTGSEFFLAGRFSGPGSAVWPSSPQISALRR